MNESRRPTASEFVDSVLRLRPQLAVFDCDGTLWDGDAGEKFFYWEIQRGLLAPEVVAWAKPRYADYKAGKVGEVEMCGEMVTIHKGIPEAVLEKAAREFFDEQIAPLIFPEMRELTHGLAQSGCELWAVSSTNDWVVREGAGRFGIPQNRILAACVECNDGCATDRLIRVPTDELKVVAIRDVIGREVDAVFGNSMHDAAMLEIARHAFAVNPNPDLEELATQRGWTVYQPSKK